MFKGRKKLNVEQVSDGEDALHRENVKYILWSVSDFPHVSKYSGKKKKMQFCRWDQIQSIYREERASKVVQFRAGWRVNPVGRECHQSKWEICIEPT